MLRINGIQGVMTVDEAEETVSALVSLGRAIPADQWVQSFADQAARVATGQWATSFFG